MRRVATARGHSHKFYYVILFNCKRYTNGLRSGGMEKFRLEERERRQRRKLESFDTVSCRWGTSAGDWPSCVVRQLANLRENRTAALGETGSRDSQQPTVLSRRQHALSQASYEKIRDEKNERKRVSQAAAYYEINP